MRLKNLFTISAGQKVTEKSLYRVLVSSICSILLCMTCLVSTTWAWFVVSIENTNNIIAIPTITANVAVTQNGNAIVPEADGSFALTGAGEYSVSVGLEQTEETLVGENLLNDSQPPVYVVMTVIHGEDMQYRLFTFIEREEPQIHYLTVGDGSAEVSFSVSWVKPAFELADNSVPLKVGQVPGEPAVGPETAPGEASEPSDIDPQSAVEEATTEPQDTTALPEITATPASCMMPVLQLS